MKRPDFDFVGRRRTWLITSGFLVALSLFGLFGTQLNLSIDFKGGTSFVMEGLGNTTVVAQDLKGAAEDAGALEVQAQVKTDGDVATGAIVQMKELDPGSPEEIAVRRALEEVAQPDDVQVTFVGPTWGDRISSKAIQALVVFLIVIMLYISFRLEVKMAGSAVAALGHDLLLTAGIYSLVGFTVSPSTVIALLTIMGYSLYDTVVVFDRVKETSDKLGGPGRRTYAESVNTSMNDVLWRSINTSMTSLLPVGSLLFLGSQLLGAETLQDLALALFIGMATGTYSSLFVAGPLLAWWKEREPELARLAAKIEKRDAAAAAAATGAGGGAGEGSASTAVAVEDRDAGELPGYVRGRGKKSRRRR